MIKDVNEVQGITHPIKPGADLRGARLRWPDLSRSDMSGVDLNSTDMSGADLSGADLSGAKLHEADLSGADLSWAHMHGADLRWTNMIGANLIGANMSGADLSEADLSGANLRGVDLSGAILWDVIGNDKEIKSIQTLGRYNIAYTSEVLQIGCEQHPIDAWWSFDDATIAAMDKGALEWWKEHKDYIRLTVEKYPATPTGR